MVEHSAEDLEASRLSLQQVVSSSDVWRARAVSAGGFLGAAAAFSLWVLSRQAATFDSSVVVVAGVAAVAYVLAVVCFLVASVMPTPKPDEDAQGSLADQLEALAHRETKPIKWLVLSGAVLGTMAIAATTLASFLVLLRPVSSAATVTIVSRELGASVKKLCPDLAQPFEATVIEDGSDFVRLRLNEGTCGSKVTELVAPRAEVVVLRSGLG